MDPGSWVGVGTSAASLVVLTARCVTTICEWKKNVEDVNGTIRGFCDELVSLQNLARELEVAPSRNRPSPSNALERSGGSGSLGIHVSRITSDLHGVMGSLEEILRAFDTTRGFPSSVANQFRLSLESGTISILRQRIVLYIGMLGVSMQSLAVTALVDIAADSSTEKKQLDEKLEQMMREILHVRRTITKLKRSSTIGIEDDEVLTHATALVDALDDFSSTASAISGAETISAALVPFAGGPDPETISECPYQIQSRFSPAQQTIVRDWISPSPSPVSLSFPHPAADEALDSPSSSRVSGLVRDVRQRRFGQCVNLMQSQRYEKAVESLVNFMATVDVRSSEESLVLYDELSLMLAEAYGKLQRFDEQQGILKHLAESPPSTSRPTVYTACGMLAEAAIEREDLKMAERLARKAAEGRWESSGPSSDAARGSLALLVKIFLLSGKDYDAQSYAEMLPLEQRPRHLQFQAHLDNVRAEVGHTGLQPAVSRMIKFLKHHYQMHPLPNGTTEVDEKEWAEIGASLLPPEESESPEDYLLDLLNFLSTARQDPRREVAHVLDLREELPTGCQKDDVARLESMMLAAYTGNSETLTTLMRKGKHLIHQGIEGAEVLLGACCGGHIGIVRMLIQTGVDLSQEAYLKLKHASDGEFAPYTHVAARSGNFECLRLLLDRGATIEADSSGRTVIHAAACATQLDCLKYLVEGRKTTIRQRDFLGRSPLHHAAEHGSTACILYLAHVGAELDAFSTEAEGRTALHEAVYFGKPNAVDTLLDLGANPESLTRRSSKERTVLELAIESEQSSANKVAVLEILFRRCPDICRQWLFVPKESRTKPGPISLACNDAEVLKSLIDFAGPAWDAHRDTLNAKNYETALDFAIRSKNPACVRLLLQHGALAIPTDLQAEGYTYLHMAADFGNLQVIRLVFDSVSPDKVDVTDDHGDTPLLGILSSRNATVDATKYLLGRGASPLAENVLGLSALYYSSACSQGVLETVLEAVSGDSSRVEDLKRDSWLLFARAIRYDMVNRIQWLEQQGYSLNCEDEDQYGLHFSLYGAEDAGNAVEYLLGRVSDFGKIMSREGEEEYPLMLATKRGKPRCLKVLLDHARRHLSRGDLAERLQRSLDVVPLVESDERREEVSTLLGDFIRAEGLDIVIGGCSDEVEKPEERIEETESDEDLVLVPRA